MAQPLDSDPVENEGGRKNCGKTANEIVESSCAKPDLPDAH